MGATVLENRNQWVGTKEKRETAEEAKAKTPLTHEEQLLAEIEYLRAENEYLKKLNALVAEREAREKHGDTTE